MYCNDRDQRQFCDDCGAMLEEEELEVLEARGEQEDPDAWSINYHEMLPGEEPFECDECGVVVEVLS